VSVRGWMGDMQCEKRREREAETKRKARRQSECRVPRSDAEANYTVVTDRIEGLPGAWAVLIDFLEDFPVPMPFPFPSADFGKAIDVGLNSFLEPDTSSSPLA